MGERRIETSVAISVALSVGGALVIALAAPAISRMWVPEIRKASVGLLAAFVAQSFMTAYGGTMSAFLNNRKTLRSHLIMYAVASVGAFGAKFWLVRTMGISGVLWGTFRRLCVAVRHSIVEISTKNVARVTAHVLLMSQ